VTADLIQPEAKSNEAGDPDFEISGPVCLLTENELDR
jgi:hypothetical protein